MITYILLTNSGELYCGKTKNLDKRLGEHRKINKKSWFNKRTRCDFVIMAKFKGDYEKKIKRAGIKFVVKITTGVSAS